MSVMTQRVRRLVPFALVCLQLQIPTVALGPALLTIQRETDLDSAAAGALTSIPVLCFAIVTPLASRVVGRFGTNAALLAASVGIGAGLLVRSSGPVPALFLGSVILGSFVAVANIAIPTLITQHFRHRALAMSSIQTAATNVGSASAAALSAPLVVLLGWQLGLGIWSALSFLAAVVWWFSVGRRAPQAQEPEDPPRAEPPEHEGDEELVPAAMPVLPMEEFAEEDDGGTHPVLPAHPAPSPTSPSQPTALRTPIAWVLGGVFATHALVYFVFSSWLPTLLQERSGLTATQAGICASVFMVLGIAGPLLLPALMRLPRIGLGSLMMALTGGWLVCTLLLFTPGLWLAAVLIGGMVQGACFTVIVTFGVHVARDADHSRGIQSVLQTIGFAAGAVGPVLIGAVRDATGGWQATLAILVAVALLMVAFGALATRMLRQHDRALAG